jgi:hypothetical protein
MFCCRLGDRNFSAQTNELRSLMITSSCAMEPLPSYFDLHWCGARTRSSRRQKAAKWACASSRSLAWRALVGHPWRPASARPTRLCPRSTFFCCDLQLFQNWLFEVVFCATH